MIFNLCVKIVLINGIFVLLCKFNLKCDLKYNSDFIVVIL